MSHLGEFELIGRIAASCHSERSEESNPPGILGIGDDCAVLPQKEGLDTLVTTDLLIEGRHFLLSDVTPEQLGWKSAAVNISDIAAMGGKPVASFLSIALPASVDAEWVDRFIAGYSELCGKFGVPLLGGDTSASPSELFINVTVIGECPHGKALVRSSARPGDLICVTGPLGDSAAGLKLILERAVAAEVPVEVQSAVPPRAKSAQNDLRGPSGCTPSGTPAPSEASSGTIGGTPAPLEASPGTSDDSWDPSAVLIRRHYLPMPRVEEGIALRECPGVHAMMDISDGIASDLRHILDASGGEILRFAQDDKGSAQDDKGAAPQGDKGAAPQGDKGAAPQGDNPTPSCHPERSEGSPVHLGAEIDLAAVPVSGELKAVCEVRGWDAAELAVSGGEDYELLVTMAPEALDKARKALNGRLFVIGRIVEGDGIRWIGGNKEYKGFTHF